MWGTGKKASKRVKRPEKQQTFSCTADETAIGKRESPNKLQDEIIRYLAEDLKHGRLCAFSIVPHEGGSWGFPSPLQSFL